MPAPLHALTRSLLVALLALALGGCVSLVPERALRAGQSSEAQVLASQGQPTRVWQNADGTRTLEYATQPFGSSCYMFTIAADGRLLGFHDALLPATRDRIVAGMTPEAVTRLLGRERSRVRFAFSGEEVWDWNVQPEINGDLQRFNVHFKDGVVLRTTMSLVVRRKGAGRG